MMKEETLYHQTTHFGPASTINTIDSKVSLSADIIGIYVCIAEHRAAHSLTQWPDRDGPLCLLVTTLRCLPGGSRSRVTFSHDQAGWHQPSLGTSHTCYFVTVSRPPMFMIIINRIAIREAFAKINMTTVQHQTRPQESRLHLVWIISTKRKWNRWYWRNNQIFSRRDLNLNLWLKIAILMTEKSFLP